jgi:hypothetical protein
MGWDMTKCVWGVPNGFTNVDATNAVNNANFALSVYVNVSAKKGRTKQAYAYVTVNNFRICVVGHVHQGGGGAWTDAGNCYIPGWDSWDMTTPALQIPAIGAVATGGIFPMDNRYPHPV